MNCVICGILLTTAGDDYSNLRCSRHPINGYFRYDTYTYKYPLSSGWVCPKCGNVYSPTTQECYMCNIQKEGVK